MPDGADAPAIVLCPAQEVVEGTARGFDLEDEGQDSIFAVRIEGALKVWRNRCPHNDAPMAWRKDGYLNAEATRIVCHAHGAEFLPQSGLCVQGPCLGDRLTAAPFEINEGGEICVRLKRSQGG
jgi:nitrite reductase/ring-hydroxylating ferredoxin subunit